MRQRTHRSLLACAALASALTLTTASFAQPDVAADHAKKGQVAYDLQDWPTAIKEYEAAYKAEQKPEYLWALAQTQRLSGKYADAIRTYKAFQRSDVSPNQANAAEMMVTKCEAELAKEEAKKAQAESAAKSDAAAAAQPATSPAPEQDKAESSGGLPIAWFITGAVITVGLGAAATWSGLDTKSKATEYEEAPTKDKYNDGKGLELRTNVLLAGTAVAALGTTVIAIFTDWSGSPSATKTEQAKKLRFQPAVAQKGGGLFVTGAF